MARRPGLRRSMGTASLTNSVLFGQLLFLLVGYSHAFYSDALRWNFCHVSAVLDEPVRAWYCGLSSLLPGAALVALEVCRDAPARRVRTFLAAVTALGVLLTCAVSESAWWSLHAGAACATFAAGIALVALVSPRRALRLMGACAVTGTLQGLKILEAR